MTRHSREPWLDQLWRDRYRQPWRVRAHRYEHHHQRRHVPYSGMMIGYALACALIGLGWLLGWVR